MKRRPIREVLLLLLSNMLVPDEDFFLKIDITQASQITDNKSCSRVRSRVGTSKRLLS